MRDTQAAASGHCRAAVVTGTAELGLAGLMHADADQWRWKIVRPLLLWVSRP
jgi:hypothetical protein